MSLRHHLALGTITYICFLINTTALHEWTRNSLAALLLVPMSMDEYMSPRTKAPAVVASPQSHATAQTSLALPERDDDSVHVKVEPADHFEVLRYLSTDRTGFNHIPECGIIPRLRFNQGTNNAHNAFSIVCNWLMIQYYY